MELERADWCAERGRPPTPGARCLCGSVISRGFRFAPQCTAQGAAPKGPSRRASAQAPRGAPPPLGAHSLKVHTFRMMFLLTDCLETTAHAFTSAECRPAASAGADRETCASGHIHI